MRYSALYVDPNRHGRGVGRLLLQQLSECLADRGATTVQIGVLMPNQDARGFYEALVVNSSARNRLFDEDGDLLPESI